MVGGDSSSAHGLTGSDSAHEPWLSFSPVLSNEMRGRDLCCFLGTLLTCWRVLMSDELVPLPGLALVVFASLQPEQP